MGLKGRKIRVKLNGQNNATPSPPLVIASRNACDAHDTKQSQKIARGLDWSCLCKQVNKEAKHKAKTKECVKPRCPHCDSYGISNLKAITSTSGIIEQSAASKNNLKFTVSLLKQAYKTAGTAMWENADAIYRP